MGEAAFGRHNLSSFGGSYRSGGMISEPAPYATTTLAMNSKMRTLVYHHYSPPLCYFHCQIPDLNQVCPCRASPRSQFKARNGIPHPPSSTILSLSSYHLLQDGKTFMSLPQREELAREENQFFTSKNNSGENQFFGNKNNSENQFFTHKTNSSSGGDSIHSELMTPPSDRYVPAISH